jgi:hypothetical protein
MHAFFPRLILAALPVFLCGADSLPQSQKSKPAREPDAAAIARLVKRLGDPKFTEREKATRALEAIGFPAIDALRKAAKDKDGEVAHRARRLVAILENSLDQLLADYLSA